MTFTVHAPTKSLLFQADDPFMIRASIPQSRTLPSLDYNVAVKHTLDNVRVLRNLGIEAPLPPYRWPGRHKPFSHQVIMTDFQCTHQRGFNLSEMGAMKTASVCWSADILMNEGTIKKAVILCPLSNTELTWGKEIFDVLPHRTYVIVHGSREKRKQMMSKDVDFYIVNHDGIEIPEVHKEIRKRKDIGLVVVDEGSKFRNANTDKYKHLKDTIRPDQWLWWLTGSPCPTEPTDAWAQARMISPQNVPQFRGTFRRQVMTQVSLHKWVPKPGGQELAFKAMQPAVRFKKSECIDLPPVTTINVQAQLSTIQEKHFKQMRTDMQAQLASGAITAVNAADQILKLRQILCGSVKDPKTEKKYITIDHKPRFKILMESIENASAKVLVIIPFKGITYELEKDINAIRGGPSCAVVNGDVTAAKRNRIFTEFKTMADPHVLLCHPEVMAHGLNLTEADTLIFYAPIYSNDNYGQVIERFNRAGQTLKMTILRIGAHPLEWAIYRMLDTKKTTQEGILDLYRTAVTE